MSPPSPNTGGSSNKLADIIGGGDGSRSGVSATAGGGLSGVVPEHETGELYDIPMIDLGGRSNNGRGDGGGGGDQLSVLSNLSFDIDIDMDALVSPAKAAYE